MTRSSYRRLRPWLAVGGVLLGCAALVTASSTVGPVAAGVTHGGAPGSTVRVLQMNLCDSGAAGCYTGRAVAEASEVIGAEAPDVVTLNEVCRDDVAVLGRALADSGPTEGEIVTAFRAAGDRRTGGDYRCRNGQPYGIGLVARLVPVVLGYAPVSGIYPMQDDRTPEERAWLCLRPAGPVPDGAVAVCTTHLASTSATVAGAQCRYLLGTSVPAVAAAGAPVPVVLGADLNLRTGGAQDVRSCVPADDPRADDGVVQHVVATPELVVGSRRTIRMHETDHPGLLVTLGLGRRTTAAAARGSLDATGPVDPSG